MRVVGAAKVAWSLALAAVLGCAPRPVSTPASVTTFGPETGLETWNATLVERVHTHGGSEGPCRIHLMSSTLGVVLATLRPEKPVREDPLEEKLGRILDDLCEPMLGRAHGGPTRMVLALRRPEPGASEPPQALLVDLPLLGPQETERTFLKGEFTAEWERPLGTRSARLENGRVHVRRLAAGGYELELFLVLRPLRSDGTWDRLQVVARLEVAS